MFQEFGFPWPSALNCSKFPPENNQDHMCMEGPGEEKALIPATPSSPGSAGSAASGRSAFHNFSKFNNFGKNVKKSKMKSGSAGSSVVSDPCAGYRLSDRFVYMNRTGRCAQQCAADVVFSGEDKTFAAVWMAVWAVLCFVATGFTVLTFLIDGSRFRYPERPIVFLAFCCHLYRSILLLFFQPFSLFFFSPND